MTHASTRLCLAMATLCLTGLTGCSSGIDQATAQTTATIGKSVQSIKDELSNLAKTSPDARVLQEQIGTTLIDAGPRIADTRTFQRKDFSALQTPLPVALVTTTTTQRNRVEVEMYFGAMAIGHSPQNVQVLTHSCGVFRLTAGTKSVDVKNSECPTFPGYLDDGAQIDITTTRNASR